MSPCRVDESPEGRTDPQRGVDKLLKSGCTAREGVKNALGWGGGSPSVERTVHFRELAAVQIDERTS
ncbi:hypothetical protein FA13DRAFT_1743127 [Coprinellus micaceus]|uniref:Uncharacterized protein n=1 Tax=Coprinellus micaceus TaxID=71717 RepID=A0A4Y7SEV3_COPMI|nr:hypothetical protein FA13DRAFT_1743127 [Coprinellus micaceus]